MAIERRSRECATLGLTIYGTIGMSMSKASFITIDQFKPAWPRRWGNAFDDYNLRFRIIGFDFDPRLDRIRHYHQREQTNLQIDPDNGTMC